MAVLPSVLLVALRCPGRMRIPDHGQRQFDSRPFRVGQVRNAVLEDHARAHQESVEARGSFLGHPVDPCAVRVAVRTNTGRVVEHLRDGFAESADLFPATVVAAALLDPGNDEVRQPVDQRPHGCALTGSPSRQRRMHRHARNRSAFLSRVPVGWPGRMSTSRLFPQPQSPSRPSRLSLRRARLNGATTWPRCRQCGLPSAASRWSRPGPSGRSGCAGTPRRAGCGRRR